MVGDNSYHVRLEWQRGVLSNTLEWFEDQDRRRAAAHRHFATDVVPFDRLIPYNSLQGKEVLEIGIGSGFHSELLARAGAKVTGIYLTDAAVERTRRRFELKGLSGDFQTWDAEQNRADTCRALGAYASLS